MNRYVECMIDKIKEAYDSLFFRGVTERRSFYTRLYSSIRYNKEGEEHEDKNCLYCHHLNGGVCSKTEHVIDSGIAGKVHSKDCDDYRYERR